MVEREARCLALEQAYVHEVYHQMGGGDHRQHPPWPRVTQFLNQLEPGSIVCDVGCGSGKYLNVNPSVFKVGVDRCSTLTDTAREEQNEVLVCDNLSLPFRDESFDAVLSIAVVHHFATTERRVGAIKELARVLRIGGRLVITAWAMEQRHRKFESQDVLVPWHRPQTLSTPSLELTPTTTTSEEDSHHHLYAACIHTSDSDSCQSARMNNGRRRSKGKLKELVPSSSSSSLSSPNESCYSFVRRALKKLAGVKRGGSRHRPWFLESWAACSWKEPPPRRYDPEGCEDIQDLPIELRRLDDDQEFSLRVFPQGHGSFSKSDQTTDASIAQKSKSLTDITGTDQKSMVRSQSSVPSLDAHESDRRDKNSLPVQKPRLVKQKQSMCDEDVDSEERDKATEMSDLIKSLPEIKVSGFGLNKRGNVYKQISMNEELLSAERLREKERVRQNIQKQASLNEELIYNRNNKTFDSLRDTLFSTSTAKRFKLIKNGLTNKIKSSTTGIEKVSGASIKNGFVRILQGWTSSDLGMPSPQATPSTPAPPQNIIELKGHSTDGKKEIHERRHSREDGSDSSKDSSLQSDTSVDSEDSFASVIFVPKSDQLEEQSTNTSPTLQSTPASPQPTSPKIKLPPPISPKMKSSSQISFALASYPSSPKMKHPGQLISSTTPTSPKIKYFPQPTSPRPFQSSFLASSSRGSFKSQQSPNGATHPNQINKTQLVATKSLPTNCIPLLVPTSPLGGEPRDSTLTSTMSGVRKSGSNDGAIGGVVSDLKQFEFSAEATSGMRHDGDDADYTDFKPSTTPGVSPTADEGSVAAATKVQESSCSVLGRREAKLPTDEENSAVKRRGAMRTQFPLVRSMYSSADAPPSRSVPRLLSLEIFNPETDDMDSDSSGLSSPDSVGSVISIKAEEEKLAEPPSAPEKPSNSKIIVDRTSGVGAELRSPARGDNSAEECSRLMLELKEPFGGSNALSTKLSPLLEAAVDVATSLEETVDAVIQSSPQARRKILQKSDSRLVKLQANLFSSSYKIESSSDESSRERRHIQLNLNKSVDENKTKIISSLSDNYLDDNQDKRWDEECRQHLADFAEKLSEKLLAEIDRYREQSSAQPLSPVFFGEPHVIDESQDPYLCKLSEDLQDLTKLSIELQDAPRIQSEVTCDSVVLKRIKGEGAAVEETLVEGCKKIRENSEDVSAYFLMEDQIPLLHEYAEDIQTQNLISTFTETSSFDISTEKKKKKSEGAGAPKEEIQSSDKENSAELSDPESTESEGNWADSRRNTILPNNKALLVKPQMVPGFPAITFKEGNKIELLPAKDMPRRPSISVEMTEPTMDLIQRDKDEVMFDGGQLHLGVSVESSEAGDISERTGSSSEGSRPSSRRETIQISDSGSVLSLRPGLSIESSEAGDYSDRAGSDGSRESRRDNASVGDITSGSQCSLLRPGNSVESSDTGDVSERTSSDVSRQNTSSAGKTPSTASFTSDKASDCSKDARFADRRMARCDGRSSSEEMPIPRTSMNKLVRQRASTQEPSELLVKAQSYETSISGSTSQDSLLSDSGGGAITFHRYYHVFREGELDQLIERYVENLHIISSYYDHANWCVVAEKVQVWTI